MCVCVCVCSFGINTITILLKSKTITSDTLIDGMILTVRQSVLGLEVKELRLLYVHIYMFCVVVSKDFFLICGLNLLHRGNTPNQKKICVLSMTLNCIL